MTTQLPAVSSSHVYLTTGLDRATELHVEQGLPVDAPIDAKDRGRGERGHNPLDLVTAALAACSAISTRSFLERDGDPGDVDVMVSLDAGTPPWLHRRVEISRTLTPEHTRLLTEALDDTEFAAALRSSFRIRTVVTYCTPDH